MSHALPCGAWPSPLGAANLASASLRLATPSLLADGSVVWLEGRPSEGGRVVLVRRDGAGTLRDVTPAPLSVRSRVHEYGGGACVVADDSAMATASAESTVYFVGFADQAIYEQRLGQAPVRLTRAEGDWRFGDLTYNRAHRRLLAVAEQRTPERAEPENFLCSIASDGAIGVLAQGADFYASPTPSPDGRQLAWLCWNHPHLPWDAAELHLAELDATGRPSGARRVAGGPEASAQQPAFAEDGALYFLLEHAAVPGDGFWNLHRWDGERARVVAPMAAELGLPLWQLGTRTWDFLDEHNAIAAAVKNGETRLWRIDLHDGSAAPLAHAFAGIGHLAARDGRLALLASFADRPGGVVLLDPAAPEPTLLRQSPALSLEPGFVSRAEAITFPTSDGDTAHGFFYPPAHPEAIPTAGEKPPLLVLVHGGPTAATTPSFSPAIQFWTTRGFGVLDVNYRGSTGYGRRFRDRLRGKWGVYDVDDVVAGARALGEAGRVDPARLAIRGGSAGGFTVLAALTGHRVFRAGASLYGVSDLSALARDTHKFESRYLDSLIGPWPAREDLYLARSPLHHADKLDCPVIFFQGLEDAVVPPSQTERLYQALVQKKVPTEYHAFEGEQHGFRRADTIRRVYEAELAFYGRAFGFGADPAAS